MFRWLKPPYQLLSRRRQKENQDGLIPYNIELEENSKEYRKSWARPIQKIYPVKYYGWTLPLYIILP